MNSIAKDIHRMKVAGRYRPHRHRDRELGIPAGFAWLRGQARADYRRLTRAIADRGFRLRDSEWTALAVVCAAWAKWVELTGDESPHPIDELIATYDDQFGGFDEIEYAWEFGVTVRCTNADSEGGA